MMQRFMEGMDKKNYYLLTNNTNIKEKKPLTKPHNSLSQNNARKLSQSVLSIGSSTLGGKNTMQYFLI